MAVKEVTRQKFDAIMSKGITLKLCPLCGGPAEIVVKIPWYGPTGAMVRCTKCGYGTGMFGIHSYFSCGKSYGTPILEKSILKGIRSSIQSWNSTWKEGAE